MLPLSLGVTDPLLSSGGEKSYAKIRYSPWMAPKGCLEERCWHLQATDSQTVGLHNRPWSYI